MARPLLPRRRVPQPLPCRRCPPRPTKRPVRMTDKPRNRRGVLLTNTCSSSAGGRRTRPPPSWSLPAEARQARPSGAIRYAVDRLGVAIQPSATSRPAVRSQTRTVRSQLAEASLTTASGGKASPADRPGPVGRSFRPQRAGRWRSRTHQCGTNCWVAVISSRLRGCRPTAKRKSDSLAWGMDPLWGRPGSGGASVRNGFGVPEGG